MNECPMCIHVQFAVAGFDGLDSWNMRQREGDDTVVAFISLYPTIGFLKLRTFVDEPTSFV